MKIYMLYDNPNDEGSNVYGVFSSEEKAEIAKDVFSSKASYELFIEGFEVDELESYLEKAKSPLRNYTAWFQNNEWDIRPCGLDSFFLSEPAKDFMMDSGYLPSASVNANSDENALEKLNSMWERLQTVPRDERGWRILLDE